MDAAALLIGNANWSSEKCVKLLRSTELFGDFPYGALRGLLLASRLIALKTSRRLFAENDPAQSGFVLADGALRCDVGGAAETPISLKPPAVIGETALVVGCLRPATVTAETNSLLIEIPRATFLRVIAEYPQSAAHARRLVLGRLRKLVDELDGVRLRLDAVAWDDVVQDEGVRHERASEG